MESSNTTGTSNLALETLQGRNDKLARLNTAPLILVAVMLVIGFVGNLHVLIFYSLRMKSTNHRNFILFLSSLDLTLCSVGMPLTLYTLKEPLLYVTRAMCKFYIFIDCFMCLASAFTMLVIAVERYRKICKPFGWQLSRRCANIACLLVLIAALVCSMPLVVNSDIEQRDFPTCVTVDKNAANNFYIFLIIMVMILLIVLIVLYTLIWKVTSIYILPKVQRTQGTEAKSDSIIAISANDSHNLTSITADPIGNKVNGMERSSSRRQKSKSIKLTLAFSLITAVFFISYIPNIVFTIVLGTIDNGPNFSESEILIVDIFTYFSAYISNTTNCFIYGFTNIKFRHEVKIMYMKLFCCKKSETKRRGPAVERRTPDPEVTRSNLVRDEIPTRSSHSSTVHESWLRTQEVDIEYDESKL